MSGSSHELSLVDLARSGSASEKAGTDRTPGREPLKDGGYWRSLEALAGDEASQAFVEREFPEGASELPDGVSRRAMLQLLGASMSLAGLAACRRPVEHIVPLADPPEDLLPGIARHYATTMPWQSTAYGLVVESHEGRPTKIEGNERHPSSGGASDIWQQASILSLYDPDRSQAVLEGGEVRSWDDFVSAWGGLEAEHLADGGSSLAVLSRSFSSPTQARLRAALLDRFPNATWVTYEPFSDEHVFDGVRAASGQDLQPLYHFDRARVIVTLDADPLLTETDHVRHTRGFAAGRAVDDGAEPNRLYAIEGVHSLTGANADHRLRVTTSNIGAFVLALAAELGAQGLALSAPSVPPVPGVPVEWLRALAADLLAHRGAGLLVAGRRQPAAVHAAVLALNQALENLGTTVELFPMPDAQRSSASGLDELVGSMAGGSVRTLVVLGANPAYDAPSDLGFAEAVGNVGTVVHLGDSVDETGELAHWHLPEAHYLEAWGDARSIDGSASVVQPLIRPLYGAHSAIELLGLMAAAEAPPALAAAAATEATEATEPSEGEPAAAGGQEAAAEAGGPEAEQVAAAPAPSGPPSAYDLVRQTWQAATDWDVTLHDGVAGGSQATPVAPTLQGGELEALAAATAVQSPTSDRLELVFQPSPVVFDGRFANVSWLQELPHPITKMTWGNAAMLSPATAAELGLTNEQLATLSIDGRQVETPVWIVPGQADNTVVVEVGYGRRAGGRLSMGTGFDAYAVRGRQGLDIDQGATLAATGGRLDIAQTQDHGSMEGRPIVREARLEDFHQHPNFAQEMVEKPYDGSLWEEWEYTEGHQWGMTIDLNSCVGCNACVIACQSENNIPVVGKEQVRNGREMQWLRIDRYFAGDESDPQTVFQAVPCQHCENAACEQVCPVAATVHDSEGLNVMVYNRCIGTRYCSNNCPYKVRRFNFFNYTKDTPEIVRLAANPDVTVRSRGVMEKCTYCTQRINAGKAAAKREGRELADGDIKTACQQVCPANAIEFGDILDEGSRVARAKAKPRNYALLDELHAKPRTTYLAKVRNLNPALVPHEPAADDHRDGEESHEEGDAH